MKLKQNSITARLYKWFYNKSILPTSFCLYFRQLVLMWIFIIPVTIISLPMLLFDSKIGFRRDELDKPNFILFQLIFSVLFYIAWVIAVIMLSPLSLFFFDFPEKDTIVYNMICNGIVVWIIVIICASIFGVKYFIDYLKEKRRKRRYKQKFNNETKSDSIIKEFVKAKYNKYCPKIEWE